ncbi:MAG: IS1182 family transposase [Candidatus Omnitrophica bacterium]|nr:IS1182 family transposase [Candidatus Omnitrophota bacterium]
MVYIKSSPKQTLLLPTNLRDVIPKDHICYLIEDVIDQLDFSNFDKEVEGPGNPSYHPRISLKIVINGICERVTSTRKLEKLTFENIVFRYLAENLNPDFHTIALFRKENKQLIKQCFLQTVTIARNLNMVNFNKLYLDGIKVKANASKSKSFTKEEIDFLSGFVDKHLEEMDEVDKEEDKKYGDSNGEPKIPDHLTSRRKLREKIKEILKDTNKAKKQMEKAKTKIKEEKVDKVNLTDMDSKMMKMKKGLHYEQAYNCQLLVEDKSEIIVGNNLSDSPVDVTETIPTMEKFKQEQNLSLEGVEVFQDNGYSSPITAEYYEKQGAVAYIPDVLSTQELHGKIKEIPKFHIDNFEMDFANNRVICPAGKSMAFHRRKVINRNKTNRWVDVYRCGDCQSCECNKQCITPGADKKFKFVGINPFMRRIRLRFKNKEGAQKYSKRFHKGEVAQGHIFHNLGYREFKMRSRKSCESEVDMFSTAYNLKKIHNKLKKVGGSLGDITKKIFFGLDYFYFVES